MHDIHTHLYWDSYDTDRDAVISRARAAGVKTLFVIGCTVEESRQCVALTEQYQDMYAAVGIHPHFFNDLAEKEFSIPNFQFSIKSQFFNDKIQKLIEELKELAQHEKVVAIGECGLDYYSHPARNAAHNAAGGEQGEVITEGQKQVQKEGFLAQIALAQELSLPLIVHCRANPGQSDAYEDMFDILSASFEKAHEANEAKKLKAILHCYMGDTEVTKKFLSLPNVYFSFTGNITYPVKKVFQGTKDDLAETVKLVPLNRIFTETDCPFLAPQSKRGERNEPTAVIEVVKQIASLQGVEPGVVDQATEANFERVFTLKKG